MSGRSAPSTRGRVLAGRLLAAGTLAALLVAGWPSVAAAHTEFDGSDPADGAVVDGPVDTVVVDFTNPARQSGDGFRLLDPTGAIREPTAVDATDGTSFVLTFDPPLTAGTYGMRWEVQAGDAHPIEGSFRFDVTGPAAVETTAAPAAGVPVTTTMSPDHAGHTTMGETMGAPEPAALEAFLATGAVDDAIAVGRIGRAFTFIGTIFGIGVLAALVWVIRGRGDELLTMLQWVRLAGLVIATGGAIELAALDEAQSSGITELLGTKPGLAAVLKIAGGMAVFGGLHAGAGRFVGTARPLSAAVAADVVAGPATGGNPVTDARPDRHRWSPTRSAGMAVALAGFVAVLGSFSFDGHTVSEGPWVLHAAANLVHLGAAAVWGGGVFAMTAAVVMRRRAHERAELAAMVVRFSSIAAVSLAAVIVAGLAMTAMIIDGPGDLVGTPWGRILLAKTAAVAAAAGIGAFNHFRLRPDLERDPDDPELAHRLRASLGVESTLMAVIVVLTAWLVSAAI